MSALTLLPRSQVKANSVCTLLGIIRIVFRGKLHKLMAYGILSSMLGEVGASGYQPIENIGDSRQTNLDECRLAV